MSFESRLTHFRRCFFGLGGSSQKREIAAGNPRGALRLQVPGKYPDEVLKGIAPIGHKHINLRGILTFDLSQLGPSLLGRPSAVVQKRALG